jgi:XTP/dITP diphosphohydrolase
VDAQTTRTIVVATTNAHKLAEITRILDGLAYAVRPVTAYAAGPAPEETAQTFAGNARLKALHYGRLVPHLTVADDSGLEIEGLDGAPGVHSARFNGATYREKFDVIYSRLRARGARASPARFVCAVAAAEGDRIVFEATGTIEGRIAETPAGHAGFGYDPIFVPAGDDRTFGEMDPAEKSGRSHRADAFRKLVAACFRT